MVVLREHLRENNNVYSTSFQNIPKLQIAGLVHKVLCILVILQEMPFCVQISIVFKCLVSFIKTIISLTLDLN